MLIRAGSKWHLSPEDLKVFFCACEDSVHSLIQEEFFLSDVMKHSQPDSAQTYLQYKQEIKSTKSTCPAVNPLHIRTSSCSVCYHTHLSENEKAAPHRSVSHLV